MRKISVALDWTPNINHIGFFVAKEKGFYENASLDVHIDHPGIDDYTLTPAKKVEKGYVDFALCPTESVLSYRTKRNPFPLIAVAAILQEDLSAIVVNTSQKIISPKDLDGKTYASYNARYEDNIVRQMIKNDGGAGDIEIAYPDKLGIWKTLIEGDYEATWVFLNWEGVQMTGTSSQFDYFKMKDYRIPYSYSPVLVTNELLIDSHKEAYKKFLKATKEGYVFCKKHPKEALVILAKYVPEDDAQIDLTEALAKSMEAFGVDNSWGYMDTKIVNDFLEWLYEQGLESQRVSVSEMMTNVLL